MDARSLGRAIRLGGAWWGRGTGPAARLRGLPGGAARGPGAERARVPGVLQGAEPGPGGGCVRFARAELRIRVASGGAVFLGWDGAEPQPSELLAGCPPVDGRVTLEPDTDGGWRVVSERVLVIVTRHGGVEVRTPGGVLLRRDLPPRWWEPVAGGGRAHWLVESELTSDAAVFGLGGHGGGAVPGEAGQRPGAGRDGGAGQRPDAAVAVTLPVQLVVATAGTHLVFHDNSAAGRFGGRAGTPGEGSGHDRPGRYSLRMAGGPVRYWVLPGPPVRALQGWSQLIGPVAVPPGWALGPQHLWERGEAADLPAALAALDSRGLRMHGVQRGAGTPPEPAARWRPGGERTDRDGETPDGEPGWAAPADGWAGVPRDGGVLLPPAEGWPGLRAGLSAVLGLGLCGVPFAGLDLTGGGLPRSAELTVRRLQLAVYLPLFRTRSERVGREPWLLGRRVLPAARAAVAERERLLPYLSVLAREAADTGAPLVRPLWWHHPADRALRACGDAFLLGEALLVAPVLEPGADRRTVRLPRGPWYDAASGAVYRGPGQVTVVAPKGGVPLLVRAGSVVPVAAADSASGVRLEVWAPPRGRTGVGAYPAADPDGGAADGGTADGGTADGGTADGGTADGGATSGTGTGTPVRVTVRLQGGQPVVARTDGAPLDHPVVVRATGA